MGRDRRVGGFDCQETAPIASQAHLPSIIIRLSYWPDCLRTIMSKLLIMDRYIPATIP